MRAGVGGTLTEPITSAVPEPAVWATMLIGFFAVAGQLRRLQRRAAV